MKNDCLSDSVLQDLGYGSVKTASLLKASGLCVDLFKTQGSCVTENGILKKFKRDNDNLNSAFSMYPSLVSTMKKLADSVGEQSRLNKSQIIRILENMNETKEQCFKTWNIIQQGITCYLASGATTEQVTITSRVIVSVKREIIGTALEKCIHYIDSVCLLTTGNSISIDLKLTENNFMSQIEQYGPACTKLKANYRCTSSSCQLAKHDVLINLFFKPYNYTFFPSESFFNNFRQKIGNLTNSVSNWLEEIFSRRLIEEDQVVAQSDSNGIDAISHGLNSGYVTTNSGATIIFDVMVVIMFINYLEFK